MIQGQLPSYIEHSMFCWKALEVFKEQEKLRQFIVNLKCLDLWSSQNDINTYRRWYNHLIHQLKAYADRSSTRDDNI